MLSLRYIELLTVFTYLLCLLQSYLLLLAPTSPPISIALWIISLPIYRGVCFLPPPLHDLMRTKNQGYQRIQVKEPLIIPDTHLSSAPALIADNKLTCYTFIPLSECHSLTEDRTNKGVSIMSASDPFQEIVDALKRILTPPQPVPPPPVPMDTNNTVPSPTVISSPMAKPAPFSGSAEECNGSYRKS